MPHDAPGGLSVGLRVSDVSARGMENLRVRFYDYEFHALEFWARDVIDLDRSNSTAAS